MSTPASAPNPTVYVRNLDESVKIPQLTSALHALFSTYGRVLDVVAKGSLKRKGQAFVVFAEAEAAARAVEEVDGFELYDRPMRLAFARSQSDATVKRQVGAESREFELHKRARLAEKERRQAAIASLTGPQAGAIDNAKAGAGGPSKVPSNRPKPATGTAVIPDEYLPPNKTLFIQNIPEDYGVESLTALFGRYAGFKEVRTVPGRTNIAFVEYENEQSAIDAKQQTGSLVLSEKTIKVTYQRQ